MDTNRRNVVPEILDELSADDPEAIRSRTDLRRINAVMGNYRWIARQMDQHTATQWLELGAGDGSIARQFPAPDQRCVTAIDLAPRPPHWPDQWAWESGDLFAMKMPTVGGVIANLFLHHFEAPALDEIGDQIRRTGASVCIFSEPARRRLHHIQGALAHPLINRVTRHDMHVSIDAGFRGDELVRLLGFADSDWTFTLNETFWGAYRLILTRNA